MTKTYRAEFFTATHWAFQDFEAETPEDALELARQYCGTNRAEVVCEGYGAIAPLDQVQIWDAEYGTLASWQSEDHRLRRAAPDLLAALEDQTGAAQAVIDNWEQGDLAGAVRWLDASITVARAALAKASDG